MTKAQIKNRIQRLIYSGHWSIARLSKFVVLSKPVMTAACNGEMSEKTQQRLIAAFKVIPDHMPRQPKKNAKGKPGHARRHLISLWNLRRWLNVMRFYRGMNRERVKYISDKDMTIEANAFRVVVLDYLCKRQLLRIFKEDIERNRLSFGDCYQFSQWVKQIKAKMPGVKTELVEQLLSRGGLDEWKRKQGERAAA